MKTTNGKIKVMSTKTAKLVPEQTEQTINSKNNQQKLCSNAELRSCRKTSQKSVILERLNKSPEYSN